MPLIDENFLQQQFQLPRETGGRLDMYIGEAGRTLRQWVGATAYGEVAAEPPTGDAERAEAFRFAEAHLAYAAALPNLATAMNHRGALKSEKSDDDAQLDYYTADEISRRVAQLTEAAKNATRKWWVSADADELRERNVPLPQFAAPPGTARFARDLHC